MSIPNKQIGWSNESNLLWQIAKQLERLTGVTSKISGGGGSSATVVTKAQVDALIASSSLVPGSTYIITGVDVPLYGGTTIMLQAETTNKLTLAGHGIFYNPKYINSSSTPANGWGIWNNYMFGSITNIVGYFDEYSSSTSFPAETVTADNGATAIIISKEGILAWLSGNWATATSITGNSSGATANVSGFTNPTYSIGQNVIWGGKHWINKTGNVGSSVDKYTLDSTNWDVVPFNSTDYNVEIDVIHYDYEHDMIVRRHDRYNNDVVGSWESFSQWVLFGYGNPIKDFQWGNYPDTFTGYVYWQGVVSNSVTNSYLDCINFLGQVLFYNTLINGSGIYENVTYNGMDIGNNKLESSSINRNVFIDSFFSGNNLNDSGIYNIAQISGDISNNTLDKDSAFYLNTLVGSNPRITYNHLTNDSSIYLNTISTNCSISRNLMSNNSEIGFNTLTLQSNIGTNTLTDYSYIGDNIFTIYGSIIENSIQNTTISGNTLSYGGIYSNNSTYGNIDDNELVADSAIRYNYIYSSSIDGNISSYGYIGFNILNSSASISYNNMTSTVYINNNNLSEASRINANTIVSSTFSNNNLTTNSAIQYSSFANDTIQYNELSFSSIGGYQVNSCTIQVNTLVNSYLNLASGTTTLSSKTLSGLTMENASTNGFDLSAATIIFGNYTKQIFKRQDGTSRLGYYNNSDVFTVVNVNA